MRSYWIVIILATLVAMGLVMVVQSQYQMVDIMNKKTEILKISLKKLSGEYLSQDLIKESVGKVLHNSQKEVDGVTAAINKLISEMEQTKTENNECQGKKTTTKEELERAQKALDETKVSLEAETEAWTKEIKNLKATLTQASPACAYVKKNTDSEKLCGKTS